LENSYDLNDILSQSHAEDNVDIDSGGVRFYTKPAKAPVAAEIEYTQEYLEKALTGVTLEERLALRFDDVKSERMSAKDRVIIAVLSVLITGLIAVIAYQIYNFAMFYSS
jgi:hypothetical protein